MENILAVAKSVLQPTVGHELLENYGPLLRTGIDKAFQRMANIPIQGQQFFASSTEKKGYKKFQGKTSGGLMKQSRDNDLIPKIAGGLGFDYEIGTVNYRAGISTERHLLETEQYGLIGKEQRELVNASQETIELILADVFNRAFGGLAYGTSAGGASGFLCEDGVHFVSSERNQPVGKAGTWSNRLALMEFTGGNDDAVMSEQIRDAILAFKRYKSDEGKLSPKTLKRVIVSPILEDLMKRITKTQMVYSGTGSIKAGASDAFASESKFSDSAVNTISGTPYTVYDWLDDDRVFFEANGENELELLWRVKPGVMTYTDGNPDMLHQRIRMALGLGCPRPTTWMGSTYTGSANL